MSRINQLLSGDHFCSLRKAYGEVADRTWEAEDLLESNLNSSRNLFTTESLVNRRPRPKKLEVFALLSGLPFGVDFINKLVDVQQQISSIIDDKLHYWVAPVNLGVEYCVFKWPTDAWDEGRLSLIHDALAAVRQPSFKFHIGGVQINPDGCVVARGFDEDAVLFRIRERLKADLSSFLPAKQSGWSHVPLGRILEPLGVEKFAKLADLMEIVSDLPIATTEIDSMKLAHETRWYMEEKTILAEYPLIEPSSETRE
jgi:hypothetical protein